MCHTGNLSPENSWRLCLVCIGGFQVAPELAHKLRLIIGAFPTQGIIFDILVEQLVRVDLRL